MVLMRCFCPPVLCYDYCHVHLLYCQEGEEKGCRCAKGGKGGSAEEAIWYFLIVFLPYRYFCGFGWLGAFTKRNGERVQTESSLNLQVIEIVVQFVLFDPSTSI